MLSDNYDEPIMEFVDLFHDSKLIHYEYRRVLDEHGLSSSVAITAAIADADLELLANIAEWGQGRFRLAQSPTDIPRMIVAESHKALISCSLWLM